jgi:hypothetical protein
VLLNFDKRSWYLSGLVGLIAIPNFLLGQESPFSAVLEPAIYVFLAFLGGGRTCLDLKEAYCMNRTSVSRAASPIWYWSEIAVSMLLAVFAVRPLGELWV